MLKSPKSMFLLFFVALSIMFINTSGHSSDDVRFPYTYPTSNFLLLFLFLFFFFGGGCLFVCCCCFCFVGGVGCFVGGGGVFVVVVFRI